MTLSLSPRSLHAYSFVRVTLQDANDHAPRFSSPTYLAAIWENNQPGTTVTTVSTPPTVGFFA